MFKKIFIYFVLAILITLLIYTFYKSEIVWEGLKRDYYYKFYIFILATSIILIFYLFVSEKIKTYLIISFLSLIFSLYLSEFYFVYLSEKLSINKKIKIYKKSTGKDYDLRSPIQFYKEYNKSNTIIPAVTPNYYFKFSNIKKLNYDLFPFSGISNSKTFVCNENGYYSIFQSDRHGFNNPDKEWDSDEIEYLLIGDSYTQGSCINRPYDIASQLRVFSKKSVLNLGYGSTGPLIQYATLREYINKKIKKIIWIYYEGNDDSDLSYELNSNFLNKYLNDKNFSQNLIIKQKKIDQILSSIIKIESQKKFVDVAYDPNNPIFNFKNFLKMTKLRSLLYLYVFKNESSFYFEKEEFIKIVNSMSELANKNNSKLYFVYLPEYKYLKYNFNNPNYSFIKKIILEKDIKFIDINYVFKKNINPHIFFPFESHGHYNEYGYAEIAKEIYAQIEK